VADDSGRAAASGEQLGNNVRQALADRGMLHSGDVSVEWVLLAHINSIGEDSALRRRRVVLCMRDLDPDAFGALIDGQPSQAEQPHL
jgi:hypothetical protein